MNLDFESAQIVNLGSFGEIPTTNAFPGWQAFFGGNQQGSVVYDNISTGGNLISIWDTNFSSIMQGKYSAALFAGPFTSSGISQSALVPLGAKSLLFDMYLEVGGVSVMLGGQPLSLVALGEGTTPDYAYTVYGADISAFAGQVEQLTFASLGGSPPGGLILDNIQFSPSPIPEPSTLALATVGLSLLGLRHRKKPSP